MNKTELIKKITNTKNSKIKFAVSDLDGILRGKYIHKNKFFDSLENPLGFCDVIFGWDSGDICYNNVEITGLHSGYPDAKARIDLDTYREIPWEENQPFFLADFSETHDNHALVCPRSLLKNIIREYANAGFKALAAFEYEWFNFTGTPSEIAASNFQNLHPVSPGMFGYSVLRSSLNHPYFTEIYNLLEKFNIPLEGLHTETGPGVLEASIIYDEALQAADKATLFKTSVKEIAYRHNMVATFMAKWNSNLPGCGGHIHQSIWDLNKGENSFFDKKSTNKLSETMEYFLAGLLTCLPEILPMYAPTVNSYKRIGHGDWAPANISWGIDNRTTAVRAIPGTNKSARLELRVPGADANPYLALSASLASGLYGIKNKLKLKIKPSAGNAYATGKNSILPGSLMEATEKMAKSELAKNLFGAYFVNHFIKTREWEWKQYSKQVSNWELNRYFEII